MGEPLSLYSLESAELDLRSLFLAGSTLAAQVNLVSSASGLKSPTVTSPTIGNFATDEAKAEISAWVFRVNQQTNETEIIPENQATLLQWLEDGERFKNYVSENFGLSVDAVTAIELGLFLELEQYESLRREFVESGLMK